MDAATARDGAIPRPDASSPSPPPVDAARPDAGAPDAAPPAPDAEPPRPDAGMDASAPPDAAPVACWPDPHDLGLLDCAALARACEGPVGSSCGGSVHPVNCCDDDGTEVRGRVVDTAGAPMAGYVRLAQAVVDPAPCRPFTYLFSSTWDPSAPIEAAGGDFRFEPGRARDCPQVPIVQVAEFEFVAVRVERGADDRVVLWPNERALDLGTVECDRSALDCWIVAPP
jgi:hypothetical protein